MLRCRIWVEEARDNQRGWITKGLKHWAQAVDTAIVSTMPGRAHIYPQFAKDVPELTIVPGLKPNAASPPRPDDLLQTFDDISGWQRVAEEVRAIADAAQADTVLLELEKAGLRARNGQDELDEAGLVKGLRLLPDDLDYIWYLSVKAHGFSYFDRHRRICEIAASVLGRRVRFTDRSVEDPAALDDWWMVRAHRTLLGLSMTETLPMMYAYEEGKIRWPTEQFPVAFEYIENVWGPDAEFILFPGGTNFNTGAEHIVPTLAMYRWLRGG